MLQSSSQLGELPRVRPVVLQTTTVPTGQQNSPKIDLSDALENVGGVLVNGVSVRGLAGNPECLCIFMETGTQVQTDKTCKPGTWAPGAVLQMPALDTLGNGSIQYESPVLLASGIIREDILRYSIAPFLPSGTPATFTSVTLYCLAI